MVTGPRYGYIDEALYALAGTASAQFWEAVTVPELERVRLRLRALVKFIEKARREPVYSNFEDEMRASELIVLPGVSTGVDTARFREKAPAFLGDSSKSASLMAVSSTSSIWSLTT